MQGVFIWSVFLLLPWHVAIASYGGGMEPVFLAVLLLVGCRQFLIISFYIRSFNYIYIYIYIEFMPTKTMNAKIWT
jgi:hypothetical protein